MICDEYVIIDAHAHVYPSKIAEKASRAIGDFYHINMFFNGSVDGLINEGKSAGIDRFLVHSVATTPSQVHKINLFLLDELKNHSEFIGFITLHPDMTDEELCEEVEFGLKNGFKGVKLHPDFQHFFVDGERGEKIYRAIDGRLPILFHAGDKRYGYSSPQRLTNVAKLHPNQNVIFAHFGGYSEWEKVELYKGLDNVYFDTSSSLFYLSKERANELIKTFGVEKFFFGTDYPMWSAEEEIERIKNLGLTKKETSMIFSENLIKFLNLK